MQITARWTRAASSAATSCSDHVTLDSEGVRHLRRAVGIPPLTAALGQVPSSALWLKIESLEINETF